MEKIFVSSPNLCGNEKKYVDDCLESTWISSKGKYIGLFESGFASYVHTSHALSCSNGTVALHLALEALGIGSGDEVLVPVLTYIATANAVRYTGAEPIFVEADSDTWNLDPAKLEEKITPRTKAILVVHLYGNPVDMDPVMRIAREKNLYVIEDAAEAHGARYQGEMVGSIGNISTFSFFGNKVITTGEGGMVVTNDDALAAKVSLLKGQGVDPMKSYWHTVVGYNYRMTNIQAAIGLAQLENIDHQIMQRQKVEERYHEKLADLSDYLVFQKPTPGSTPVCWMFSVLLRETVSFERDEVMNLLAMAGIETRPLFYPITQLPPYVCDETFPVAERIASRGMNLPTHSLMTTEQVDYVCQTIRGIIGGQR